MDRFIASAFEQYATSLQHLKSNMDRFIVIQQNRVITERINLKSNMDRFIVDLLLHILNSEKI